MRIPNYDSPAAKTKCKQLKSFVPNDNFRMLICGPSGYGKTNTLMHMIYHSWIMIRFICIRNI